MPETPENHTYNMNIVSICNLLTKDILEIMRNQSSVVSGFLDADVQRLNTYIAELTAYKNYASSLPVLDTPVTHQLAATYAVYPLPETQLVDNNQVNELINTMVAFRNEMLHSQSSRLSNSLIPQDWVRFDTFIARMETMISSYITPTTFTDNPETSPSFAVPAGNPHV